MVVANAYGVAHQTEADHLIDQNVEQLSLDGYTILKNVLGKEELAEARELIDGIYIEQENNFGKDRLRAMNEQNVCRFCLKYSENFMKYILHLRTLPIVERYLGNYFILHLQNSIISHPAKKHHQSQWHRDLPHFNYMMSAPIALNVLFAIDDCNEETGGTYIIPGSHKFDALPSESYLRNYEQCVDAEAGDVILFDSMLFYRAGTNRSQGLRRTLNHVFTNPYIKQQYDIAGFAKENMAKDHFIQQLMGVTSATAKDDVEWRENRLRKIQNATTGNALNDNQ